MITNYLFDGNRVINNGDIWRRQEPKAEWYEEFLILDITTQNTRLIYSTYPSEHDYSIEYTNPSGSKDCEWINIHA